MPLLLSIYKNEENGKVISKTTEVRFPSLFWPRRGSCAKSVSLCLHEKGGEDELFGRLWILVRPLRGPAC